MSTIHVYSKYSKHNGEGEVHKHSQNLRKHNNNDTWQIFEHI